MRVLKYSPDQERGKKGTPQGGKFVRMDWGSTESKEPPPTHARRNEVSMLHTGLVDQAKKVAGPTILADVAGRTHVDATGTKDTPSVETPEVRAAMKKAIQQDLTERLRNHPAFKDLEPKPPLMLDPVAEFVKTKINQWAESAGDSDIESIQMQRAVKEEFNLTEAEMRHMAPMGFAPGTPLTDPPDHERNKAFVRAEYERTQEYLKSKGLTHVSLFRGMKDDDDSLGYGFEDVTMQPASSWTTDVGTAFDFATNEVGGFPKVLTTRVPISEVLSTCVTGRGCLSEYEVLLLGKPQRAQVFGMVAFKDILDTDDPEFSINADATINKIKKSLK